MYRTSQYRNFKSASNRKNHLSEGLSFSMGAVAINTYDINQGAADALRRDLYGLAAPVKYLAEVAGVSIRTAKNWYEGKNSPQLAQAIPLIGTLPHYRDFVLGAANIQTAGHIAPEQIQTINDAISILTRMGGNHAKEGQARN